MSAGMTITIARLMGSGGSFVGQILAERLGVKFIDREVLHQCADSFGVDNALLKAREERLTTFWEKLFGGITLGSPEGPYTPPPLRPFNDRELFERQVEILNRLAREEDAVIVGWAGALVLPPSPGLTNIYLHAPAEFRVERVMEVYQTPTREQARQAIADSDRRRKLYFKEMTGKDWDCADNYHLSVDSSLMPLSDLAEMLLVFIERKTGRKPQAK